MNVYKLGRKQAAAVSPVPYLLKTHDLWVEEEEVMFDKENYCPNKVTKEIWKLRCSLSPRKKSRGVGNVISPAKVPLQRRSERGLILSTKQSKLDDQVACLLEGHPPHPATYWPRTSLIDALVTLAPTRRTCEFIDRVISLGNSPYT